jgi:hypothetical protein
MVAYSRFLLLFLRSAARPKAMTGLPLELAGHLAFRYRSLVDASYLRIWARLVLIISCSCDGTTHSLRLGDRRSRGLLTCQCHQSRAEPTPPGE